MFAFVNVEDGADMFFGFRVVNDFLVSVDLVEGSANQIVNEGLPFDFYFFEDFLVVNDTLDDFELFPLDKDFKISKEQFPLSYFVVNSFLQI